MISSSLIFSDRMCGIITILLAVSGMDFSRCQPLCSHLIASDDQHGKCIRCVGLAHGWDAIFGISNCKYCENFTLKALHARPTVFDQESAFLPCRATLEASSLCEAAAWSSDAELEAMESEVFSLSIAWASLREFFGQVLSWLSCTQPGGTGSRFLQDGGYFVYRYLRISPAYTELVDILARATEKLNLDWQDEPCESQSSKLDERFLSGSGSCPARIKLPFYPDLLHEISKSWKQPFSSHLTIVAAADFTNLVGSVEHGYAAVPVIEDTLAAHLSPNSAPSW